jgi:hypothetical protein
LFAAVAKLAGAGSISAQRLRLRFRASVHDDLLHDLSTKAGVREFVETLPPVGYREALSEMRRADGLLVLQSAGCNAQVPAKVYEYLRAGRPTLCLTDAAGDTAGVLRTAGLDSIVAMDDADAIAVALDRFVHQVQAGQAAVARPDAVLRASRSHRSLELAELLARLCR